MNRLELLFGLGGLALAIATLMALITVIRYCKSRKIEALFGPLPYWLILGAAGLWLMRSIIEQWANI
jgi:uncharacterized membrane protein